MTYDGVRREVVRSERTEGARKRKFKRKVVLGTQIRASPCFNSPKVLAEKDLKWY